MRIIYLEGKQRLQKAGNESPAFDAYACLSMCFI